MVRPVGPTDLAHHGVDSKGSGRVGDGIADDDGQGVPKKGGGQDLVAILSRLVDDQISFGDRIVFVHYLQD